MGINNLNSPANQYPNEIDYHISMFFDTVKAPFFSDSASMSVIVINSGTR